MHTHIYNILQVPQWWTIVHQKFREIKNWMDGLTQFEILRFGRVGSKRKKSAQSHDVYGFRWYA